ncbi:cation transporter [bacterium]|nr:MAG: cation transporter [bacterium]
MEERKARAARLSLAYNIGATALKVVAAAVTGSVSLFGEATHSAIDIVASLFAVYSVKVASVPPDEEHPYGHGKVESLAGFGESLLLLATCAFITFQAITRLIHPLPPGSVDLGIWIMGISAVTSFLIGRSVAKVGTETGSLALQSNGQHLFVDCWTSVGVLAALVCTRLTGWNQADPVFALGLAAWMGWGSWGLFRTATNELIDHRVHDEDMSIVCAILDSEEELCGYHKLRTRHSGSTHFIDVHIEVPDDWSLVRAHDLADRIERRIHTELAPAIATIHVDPARPDAGRTEGELGNEAPSDA